MRATQWYRYDPNPDEYGGVFPQPTFTGTNVKETRFSEAWPGWNVTVHPGSEGFGDFISEGAMPPILSRRTVELLREVLVDCGVVPLQITQVTERGGEPMVNAPPLELFAIDPPILSNAVDVRKSDVAWLDEAQTLLLRFRRYHLRTKEVLRYPIFRLAEDPREAIVSKAFREAVEKHDLKGLSFHPLDATWEP